MLNMKHEKFKRSNDHQCNNQREVLQFFLLITIKSAGIPEIKTHAISKELSYMDYECSLRFNHRPYGNMKSTFRKQKVSLNLDSAKQRSMKYSIVIQSTRHIYYDTNSLFLSVGVS